MVLGWTLVVARRSGNSSFLCGESDLTFGTQWLSAQFVMYDLATHETVTGHQHEDIKCVSSGYALGFL